MWLGDLYKEFKGTYQYSYFSKSKTAFTNKCKESFKGLVSERKNREVDGYRRKDYTIDIRTILDTDYDNDTPDNDDDEPPF